MNIVGKLFNFTTIYCLLYLHYNLSLFYFFKKIFNNIVGKLFNFIMFYLLIIYNIYNLNSPKFLY